MTLRFFALDLQLNSPNSTIINIPWYFPVLATVGGAGISFHPVELTIENTSLHKRLYYGGIFVIWVASCSMEEKDVADTTK